MAKHTQAPQPCIDILYMPFSCLSMFGAITSDHHHRDRRFRSKFHHSLFLLFSLSRKRYHSSYREKCVHSHEWSLAAVRDKGIRFSPLALCQPWYAKSRKENTTSAIIELFKCLKYDSRTETNAENEISLLRHHISFAFQSSLLPCMWFSFAYVYSGDGM